MSNPTILIVDDEETLATSLAYGLKKRGFEPIATSTGAAGLRAARDSEPDLVLLDLWLPDQSGLVVLEELRKQHGDLPVIMITAHGDTQNAVDAMKLGAVDFVLKPFELEEVAHLIGRTLEFQRMEHEVRFRRRQSVDQLGGLVVDPSSPMMRLVEQVSVAARSQTKIILLLGESGTGKAMIAKLIHDESQRADQPFVEVNCAAIPHALFESQLFGHEKGSFTDAKEAQLGLIRLAEGGTLFLDEIGEMPLPLQAKLLQYLESQRMRPVGGKREYTVETRVVAATNRDLQQEVQAGRFRSDLFYRINILPFTVPPLRERKADLQPLWEDFAERAGRTEGTAPIRLSPAVQAVLSQHDWPGNVRELKNLIERWTILHPGHEILPSELPPEMHGPGAVPGEVPLTLPANGSIEEILDSTERRLIEQALAEAAGHRGRTAERLGISRHALKRRMQRLGMDGD